MLTATCRQPNPARREHAQHVSVGEQHDVTGEGARPGYHPIDPGAHLLGRLAARTSIPEDESGATSWICFGVSPSYIP